MNGLDGARFTGDPDRELEEPVGLPRPVGLADREERGERGERIPVSRGTARSSSCRFGISVGLW